MNLTMNDPIDALVIYRRGAPHPHLRAFRWNDRRYDVTATHLVHCEREGNTVDLVYSVRSGNDTFVVRLDTSRGRWTLETLDSAD